MVSPNKCEVDTFKTTLRHLPWRHEGTLWWLLEYIYIMKILQCFHTWTMMWVYGRMMYCKFCLCNAQFLLLWNDASIGLNKEEKGVSFSFIRTLALLGNAPTGSNSLKSWCSTNHFKCCILLGKLHSCIYSSCYCININKVVLFTCN